MKYPLESLFGQAVIEKSWNDWSWQQQHALRSNDQLMQYFPNLPGNQVRSFEIGVTRYRLQITPYLVSLINIDEKLNPVENDPIWTQYFPLAVDDEVDNLDTLVENWELPREMVTPILQHKYHNRVNFRIQNGCLSYCLYCFEAKRVLDYESTKGSFSQFYFEQSLGYIDSHEEVSEVVISGGEPLTLSNGKLRGILKEIRRLAHVKNIRIQTRAFVHNPFRIDDEFVELLNEFNVTALGVHVSHPQELSEEFEMALSRIEQRKCRVLLLGQIPLLKGINDDVETLRELFEKMYHLKIKPYYLLHAMPFTLESRRFRTSVRKGVVLMQKLKRNYSNPALPEYVIVHHKGKHTVPLEMQGTPEFQYLPDRIKFLNWKGEWCTCKRTHGTDNWTGRIMFSQVIVNSLVAGSIIAFTAIGFAIIYQTCRFFHFAHGAVFAFGPYFAYTLCIQFGMWRLAAFPLACLMTAMIGVACELSIYRPMRRRKATDLTLLISSLGLYMVLQNVLSMVWGDDPMTMRTGLVVEGHAVFGARITDVQIAIIGVSLLLLVIMGFSISRTKFGKALRAIANDPELARLSGIDTDRYILYVFALGSFLAGVSAIMISFDTDMTPTMGFNALMMGVVAVIIGGIDSMPGAVLGGMLIGAAQNFAVYWLPSKWQNTIAFALLIFFLILRPYGILGKKPQRVNLQA